MPNLRTQTNNPERAVEFVTEANGTVLIIGPQSGWTTEDYDMLFQALKTNKPADLKELILRDNDIGDTVVTRLAHMLCVTETDRKH